MAQQIRPERIGLAAVQAEVGGPPQDRGGVRMRITDREERITQNIPNARHRVDRRRLARRSADERVTDRIRSCERDGSRRAG